MRLPLTVWFSLHSSSLDFGIEAVRGDDGIGITVSYWRSRQDIANWRRNAEHMVAQALGRQEFLRLV